MSIEVDKLKSHLTELEKFMTSVAYSGYVAARETEILTLEQAIVAVEPINREDIAEHFKLRGELRCQQEMLTTFEDARQTLKDRINETIEREHELATTTKV